MTSDKRPDNSLNLPVVLPAGLSSRMGMCVFVYALASTAAHSPAAVARIVVETPSKLVKPDPTMDGGVELGCIMHHVSG